ncbi:uncharacterized protein LOC111707362 isoform X2 [Eurytemora carolleeae]|uniref:uncharacterized protein LOC111707362 isoform X2 n=1 Tax=Eurytemora carolleeae TaxID=1294199 RepID=UPI000C771176|nr:uncharacterized protein LOC111707362 isoform X2 [Eurytemora carolleeae]|eukprot:XP_023336227.1 uncharacterized protein LOC111707362 isoform X2 [Eurytemora affinis]
MAAGYRRVVASEYRRKSKSFENFTDIKRILDQEEDKCLLCKDHLEMKPRPRGQLFLDASEQSEDEEPDYGTAAVTRDTSIEDDPGENPMNKYFDSLYSEESVLIQMPEETSNINNKKMSKNWRNKQMSVESQASMDDAIRRILKRENIARFKIRKERKIMERWNNYYTLLAVIVMICLSLTIVGIKILLSEKPKWDYSKPSKPTGQWMMDWNIDIPGAPSKPRHVPVHWESIYNLDYWIYHRNNRKT